MSFQDFLSRRIAEEPGTTEDVLAEFLPLLRETIETHRAGFVAPLDGLQALQVDGTRIWFEQAKRRPIRRNLAALERVEQADRTAVDVIDRSRRTGEVGDPTVRIARADVGVRGESRIRHDVSSLTDTKI